VGAGRLCAAVVAGGFRRYATYRTATVAGGFTNTVFGVILVHTHPALRDARPHPGGYDPAQAVTYVWPGRRSRRRRVGGRAGRPDRGRVPVGRPVGAGTGHRGGHREDVRRESGLV